MLISPSLLVEERFAVRTRLSNKPRRARTQMSKRERTNLLVGYAFISPQIIGLLAFTAVPFIYSLYLAFTDFTALQPANWVGLKNFTTMLTKDPKFWTSFFVTVKFAVVQVPLKLGFALFVAVLLAKNTKSIGFYRSAFYIPSILGGSVAIAMTWKQLWGTNGVINGILSSLGLPTVMWLNNTNTALYVLILLGVWQFGAAMLIFLAGIKDIPDTYYEAAIVDGAGKFTCFLKITLPLLTPSLFFNLINGIIGSLQAFNSAYLITGGGPLNSTLYYGLYLYRQAFSFNKFGYASAMAWFMLLVISILTALVFRSSGAWVYYQDERK